MAFSLGERVDRRRRFSAGVGRVRGRFGDFEWVTVIWCLLRSTAFGALRFVWRSPLKKLELIASFVVLTTIGVYCSTDTPIGRVEVVSLLAGGTPAVEVERLVQRHGINFQPTEGFLNLMARAESEMDSGKERLAQSLLTAHVVNLVPEETPHESEALEHLAHGAEVAWSTFPPNPERSREIDGEFRQALQTNPENPFLHFALGNALIYEGKFDLAASELRETLRVMPDLTAVHTTLGRALAGKGDQASALAELREAVRIDPTSPTARSVLASVLLANRDPAGATEELREGLRLRPDDPALHNTLGTVLYESGNTDAAIAEFRQAIELGSKDPQVHTDLASALRKKGDLDGAIAELREAACLAPKSFWFHYSLGLALVDRKDLAGAKTEYREAIRLRPDFALSHSELGYVLKKEHDLDGAIAEYREAIRLDPKLAVAHANLGAALFANGQHDASYEEVLVAHELAPNDPTISVEFSRLPEAYKQRATQPPGELRPPAAALGEPETADFLFYMGAQELVALEAETPTIGGKRGAFGGISAYMTVIGERSPVRLKPGSKWEFVIRPASAAAQLDFRLEKFEAKGGSRTLISKKKLEPSSSSDKPGLLMFDSSSFGKSSIKLTVPYDLAPGEYGFFVTAKGDGWKMFCFGVDSP
jgi:Flp pilus assembly protein TadD